MKGVFIINTSLHDIVFMTLDGDLVEHYVRIAVEQGLIRKEPVHNDTKETFIDPDVLVQLLVPLFNSQHFLMEEMNTAYKSITCSNGFLFVFAQYVGHVFLAINGDSSESEEFMFRKLAVLNRILTFIVGPVIKEVKPRHPVEREERWKFIGKLLQTWCDLYSTEQMFLCEATEQLNMTEELNSKCISVLDSAIESVRRATHAKVEHAVLVANSKILTVYSSNNAVSAVFTSDKLLLILLVQMLCLQTEDRRSDRSSETDCKRTKNVRHRYKNGVKTSQRSEQATFQRQSEPAVVSTSDRESPSRSNAADIQSTTKRDATSEIYCAVEYTDLYTDSEHSPPVSCDISPHPGVINPLFKSEDCFTSISFSFEPLHGVSTSSKHELAIEEESAENEPEQTDNGRQLSTPCDSDAVDHVGAAVDSLVDHQNVDCEGDVFCSHTDFSELCGEPFSGAADGFNYRRINVFLQEGIWKYSPHTLHCIRLDQEVTLVIVCEFVHKSHAKLLSHMMELIASLTNGKWKRTLRSAAEVDGAVENCIRKLAMLPASYIELQNDSVIGQLIEDLCAAWKRVKGCEFSTKLDSSGTKGLGPDERLIRLLRDMYGHAAELFRVLFLRPRMLSLEVQSLWRLTMSNVQQLANSELRVFRNYVDVVVRTSLCSQSFMQKFPSVAHFIYVDRKLNTMISPPLVLGSGNNDQELLKRNVWKMYDTMRNQLPLGHMSSTIHNKDYSYFYSLIIEDLRGRRLLPSDSFCDNQWALPGTLCQAFYRQMMKACSTPSVQPVRCFELFCVFRQPSSGLFMHRQNRLLLTEINKLIDTVHSTTPFVLF